MQQRQLRLGDILDDYCPRERRVTNHAVVAMVGDTVKQTRCTTCDAEHEYKHARVPRPRKKSDAPGALYAQVVAGAPKRVVTQSASPNGGPPDEAARDEHEPDAAVDEPSTTPEEIAAAPPAPPPADDLDDSDEDRDRGQDEGPIHRRLIRASLPRPEGQQPPARPIPEFTIRQPGGGRPNRFRPRHHRGGQGSHGQQFQGGHRQGGGNMGNAVRGQRPGGGRPGPKRHGGHGRKRSK
jgi:hypothetical protein